jgi:hypothetical protein
MSVLYLNQLDPKWGNKKIGNTFCTIARWGCAITSLCMSLADFGIIIYPDELACHPELFNAKAEINWTAAAAWLHAKYPNHTFNFSRYYGCNDYVIQHNLIPGVGVLIRVAGGTHWIKADRKMLLRNDYNCRDPLRGKGCAARGDYHNIDGFLLIKVT